MRCGHERFARALREPGRVPHDSGLNFDLKVSK